MRRPCSSHGWENPIHSPWRENYIRCCVRELWAGITFKCETNSARLRQAAFNLAWRGCELMEGDTQHYLSAVFYLSAVALDESMYMCASAALLLSYSDTHTRTRDLELLSCGSARLPTTLSRCKFKSSPHSLWPGYLTQIGLHSQQLAIQRWFIAVAGKKDPLSLSVCIPLRNLMRNSHS